MGSGNNENPTISRANIVECEKNIQIATEKVIVVINKAGSIPLVVPARTQPRMVSLADDRKEIHPDMQTVVIDIPLDKFDPVGVVDQRFKARATFYNIPEIHIATVSIFTAPRMDIPYPFLSRIT